MRKNLKKKHKIKKGGLNDRNQCKPETCTRKNILDKIQREQCRIKCPMAILTKVTAWYHYHVYVIKSISSSAVTVHYLNAVLHLAERHGLMVIMQKKSPILDPTDMHLNMGHLSILASCLRPNPGNLLWAY